MDRQRTTVAPALGVLLSCAAAAAPGIAQCEPTWLPGRGIPGVDGEALATVAWDPDGAGPAPVELVVGGDFGLAGSARCNGLARCDLATATWSAFAPEVFARVSAMATLPNGDLVVAGVPTSGIASGSLVQRVARWNGAWSWLGGDFTTTVNTLHVTPGGQLFAGGVFQAVGGQPAHGIARWNGAAWVPLGSGVDRSGGVGQVKAMASLANGDLLVAGWFDVAGGAAIANVARWNGAAWLAVGAGLPGPVQALVRTPNGLLFAGGDFTTGAAGQSAAGLAVWNGAAFAPVFGLSSPYPSPPAVRALLPLPGARMVVAGFLQVAGTPIRNLAILDTATFAWSSVGAGAAAATDDIGYVNTLARLPLGHFAVGGQFFTAGEQDATNVASWNGAAWQPLGAGINNGVACAATLADGTLVVGGGFRQIDGQTRNGIALRNGSVFLPLGSGLTTASGRAGVAAAILPLPQGGCLVGGNFAFAGGVPAMGLAHWDGAAWAPFAGGVDGGVQRIVRTHVGDLVVIGRFDAAGGTPAHNIARWNGTAWSGLGTGIEGSPYALVELPNGDLLVAGYGLTPFADVLLRWDGTAWTPLPPPSPTVAAVFAMRILPNGDLVVGGFDVSPPYGVLSRRNGTSWMPFAAGFDGEITALHVLPDGDLVVGGAFATVGGQPMAGLARFDGSSWTPVDGGLGAGPGRATVATIEPLSTGNLVVGGFFSTAGRQVSAAIAELLAPCAPTVTSEGQGCPGAAGALALTTDSLPWLGATFAATATGVPSPSIAVHVLGQQPQATPLLQLVPQAGPNCVLFVAPLLLQAHVPTTGVLPLALPIPDVPALVGQVLRQQVVVFELGAAGGVQLVTGSNALVATLGTL